MSAGESNPPKEPLVRFGNRDIPYSEYFRLLEFTGGVQVVEPFACTRCLRYWTPADFIPPSRTCCQTIANLYCPERIRYNGPRIYKPRL